MSLRRASALQPRQPAKRVEGPGTTGPVIIPSVPAHRPSGHRGHRRVGRTFRCAGHIDFDSGIVLRTVSGGALKCPFNANDYVRQLAPD